MAEAFLSQLLQAENRVQPSSDQPCMICLTKCDTLCPETGIVEWEIRLPCQHTVGSRCISKWLDPSGAANNTCPLCRYVFFAKQPESHLGRGNFDEDDLTPAAVLASNDSESMDPILHTDEFDPWQVTDESDDPEDTEDYEDLMRSNLAMTCENLCQGLDLGSSPRVVEVSIHLAKKIYLTWRWMDRNNASIEAFAVLLASHMMGVPRSLFQVSNASLVDEQTLFNTYRFFLRSRAHRAELLDEEILDMMDRDDLETVLSHLPEDRGLFLPEESAALDERGGLEAYRLGVAW